VRTGLKAAIVVLGAALTLTACAPATTTTTGYVRASTVARQLNMRMSRDRASGRVVLRGNSDSGPVEAVVSPGFNTAWINGRQYRLSRPSRYYGSDVLVDPALGRTLRAALTVEQAVPGLRTVVHKVVLDPGHGGKDPGCIGPRGVREKDVNLGVAMELAGILRSRGVTVVLTRTTDVFIELEDRSRIANREQPDLFISIHADAAERTTAEGSTTFFVEEEFTHRGQHYDLLDRAVLAARDATLNVSHVGATPPGGAVNLALWQILLAEYRQESRQLAEAIQKRLPGATGQSDRGVREARYAVLKWTYAPAVLVEVGFLSNPYWESRLGDPRFRRQTAQAIADAIADFDRQLALADAGQ
jgi:N-acetylmuramoyl-L-alanine amidase